MTHNVLTLTTPTRAIIKEEIPLLEDQTQTESNKMELSDQFRSLTEDIIENHVRGLTFTETMLFAHNLCNAYDVADSFPPEQREDALRNADDWRDAATSGLYHIIMHSLEEEYSTQKTGFKHSQRMINEVDDQELLETMLKSDDEFSAKYICTPHKGFSYDITEYSPNRVETAGDKIIQTLLSLKNLQEPDEEADLLIEQLKNSEFIVKTLIMDYITDATGFTTWNGMTDTACRDDFAHRPFTKVIDTVIEEFRYQYDPNGQHKHPVAPDH